MGQVNLGNQRWLPLLDNYPYDATASAPSVSDTAMEVADALLRLIERLPLHSSASCIDALLCIAHATRYPCTLTPRTQHTIRIDDVPLDVIDYLLSVTIDKTQSSIRCRAVVLMLYWLLTGQQDSLSKFLKNHGLNSTVAGVLVRDCYDIFNI